MNRTSCTRPARCASHLAGLVLTAVALTACGGRSDGADEPDPAPADSPSATTSDSPTGKPTKEPPSKKASPEPAGPTAAVTVKGGSVDPLAQSVGAEVGEKVTLEISSDRAGELHVHASPEQYHDFGPGRTTVEMTFDKPGAVDVEEHESGALILRVLVQ